MAFKYLHVFPILVFLWFPVTILISYTIAVILGHVNALFPYISDTGTYSPESCIFGQLFNMGIIILGCVIYIRYRQIRLIYETNDLPVKVQRFNKFAGISGLIGIIGFSFVSNFQETNEFTVHLTAALFGFGGSLLYCSFQTWLSYKIFPLAGNQWINLMRGILVAICVVTFFICFICGGVSIFKYESDISKIMKWNKLKPGYGYHIASTVTEWLMTFIMMLYILTYFPEFKSLSLTEPDFQIETRDAYFLGPDSVA